MAAVLKKSIRRLSWACERLGRLLCSRKISVFWPWLRDQKENLIGLMKADTVKLTTEIQTRWYAVVHISEGSYQIHFFSLKRYLWAEMSKILTFFYFLSIPISANKFARRKQRFVFSQVCNKMANMQDTIISVLISELICQICSLQCLKPESKLHLCHSQIVSQVL